VSFAVHLVHREQADAGLAPGLHRVVDGRGRQDRSRPVDPEGMIAFDRDDVVVFDHGPEWAIGRDVHPDHCSVVAKKPQARVHSLLVGKRHRVREQPGRRAGGRCAHR
jgi:hypothetical protein